MAMTGTRAAREPEVSRPKASARAGVPPTPVVKTPRRKKPVPGAMASELLDALTRTEHIRVRAYYLFLNRNGLAPDPVGDWLRAERELVGSGTDA